MSHERRADRPPAERPGGAGDRDPRGGDDAAGGRSSDSHDRKLYRNAWAYTYPEPFGFPYFLAVSIAERGAPPAGTATDPGITGANPD